MCDTLRCMILMGPKEFRHWRKSLALKQKDAAALLGLKKRMIQYYEKGERDGKPIVIPKYVRLACYALSEVIADFDGERAHGKPEPTVSPGDKSLSSGDQSIT